MSHKEDIRRLAAFHEEKSKNLRDFHADLEEKEKGSNGSETVDLGLIPEQVARDPSQITEDTQAYVGDLVYWDANRNVIPIFDALEGVEYIYASPKEEIPQWRLKIGDGESLDDVAMLETLRLVRLKVRDLGLGFFGGATTREIITRADELGLMECPTTVGPVNAKSRIFFNPIDRVAAQSGIFELSDDGFWLRAQANPGCGWLPADGNVFCLRQVTTKTPSSGI